jgi:hypothetical protein
MAIINDNYFIVFENGGVDFDPQIHGIFRKLKPAQDEIKDLITDFLTLHKGDSPVIEKQTSLGNTSYVYFYVYADKEEHETGNYINVFGIATISNETYWEQNYGKGNRDSQSS